MTITSLCPQALIFVLFAMTHIVLDTMKGYYNEAFIKIWVSLIYTLILNILCTRGLGTIAWFLVLLPFIFMTAIVAMIIFSFGLSENGEELNIFERSNNQQMRSIPNIMPGVSNAAKDIARKNAVNADLIHAMNEDIHNNDGSDDVENSKEEERNIWDKLKTLLESTEKEKKASGEPVASNDVVESEGKSEGNNDVPEGVVDDGGRKDCVGQWTEWVCDNDPEVPIKRRRFVVSQEATKGGKRCSIEHGKEESAACKKVDCVGKWKWEDIACKDYGSGLQNKKVFSITQKAEWGGKECKWPDGNIQYGPCTKVEIKGVLKKGSELTASPTNFAPTSDLNYSWYRIENGKQPVNIATNVNKWTLVQEDVGNKIKVEVANKNLDSNEKPVSFTTGNILDVTSE